MGHYHIRWIFICTYRIWSSFDCGVCTLFTYTYLYRTTHTEAHKNRKYWREMRTYIYFIYFIQVIFQIWKLTCASFWNNCPDFMSAHTSMKRFHLISKIPYVCRTNSSAINDFNRIEKYLFVHAFVTSIFQKKELGAEKKDAVNCNTFKSINFVFFSGFIFSNQFSPLPFPLLLP